MASSATIVETKKIAVRSLIVESFRGCGLRLRSPFAVAVCSGSELTRTS